MDRFNSVGIDDFDCFIHPEELLMEDPFYEEWLSMVMSQDDPIDREAELERLQCDGNCEVCGWFNDMDGVCESPRNEEDIPF